MLRAIPRHWFSWNYRIFEESQHVADIDVSWWCEKGLLTVQGDAYQVYREGPKRGAFILESSGTVLARAEKPSVFLRCFFFEHKGRFYTLRASSAFRREFILLDGAETIGFLSPEGIFTNRASVDLPETLPLAVRVFIVWLTVILWRRESDSNPAA